ncbi:MAG: prepilin-type N-terminal cleavage/methylation domain-containing protein [Methylobacter sp.]|nr:prepilin-type N-terminal cleavage/methylation domain-containing protein [Methylobacter sp.]
MATRIHTLDRGFSLIELTVVLLLITLLSGIAVRETNALGFQTRYEQTRERLDMITQAILGNPKQIINGQQAVNGFVADMGRLPNSLRELMQRSGDCSDDAGDVSQTECLNLATPGVWTASAWNDDPVTRLHSGSTLQYGWHGPYLNISGNPADNDAFSDGWGNLSNDNNYGWNFINASPALTLQSKGKNQTLNPADTGYDEDYPAAQPRVRAQDWMADIGAGVNVNFKKPSGKLPPVSVCTDPTKTTKTTCTASGATWDGGCENAGYFNKSSCPGAWSNCSDATSASKSACELAGKDWYGEGFGCSDQAKSNKALCTSPGVWRSCTDNGTITSQTACLSAGQIWYGEDIFSINTPSATPICMKIFYRKPDATIGILVSDEDKNTANSEPKSIIADASFQTIRFANFRDSSSNSLITELPIGTNAIGLYKHDGTACTNTHYPADRQNPIQVDFHPRSTLPVLNW